MSGYLYFPNNFKDIKDHIQADMISCKIFFQLMVTVFKENLNLQLPLIFYSSIRFVFETAFISEQIAENRFGPLREISNKFITKFHDFSYTILQVRRKTVWKISKPQRALEQQHRHSQNQHPLFFAKPARMQAVFGREKIDAQKIKKLFFSKIRSIL